MMKNCDRKGSNTYVIGGICWRVFFYVERNLVHLLKKKFMLGFMNVLENRCWGRGLFFTRAVV